MQFAALNLCFVQIMSIFFHEVLFTYFFLVWRLLKFSCFLRNRWQFFVKVGHACRKVGHACRKVGHACRKEGHACRKVGHACRKWDMPAGKSLMYNIN
jgi:hypothetical protein